MVPGFLHQTFKRLFVVLLGYSLARLVFLFWNWSTYSRSGLADLFWSLFLGIRFDLSALILTNSIFILLWLLPWPWWKSKVLRETEYWAYLALNTFAIGLNFIDVDFVNFTGKRTSFEIFKLQQDIQEHSLSILWSYKWLGLSLVLLMVVLARFISRWQIEPRRTNLGIAIVSRLALVGILILGIRGGTQVKPLHPMHAYWSPKHELGLLTLNTTFNIIRTRHRSTVERPHYYKRDREAIERLEQATRLSRPPLGLAKNFNVVVIILESFASEYVGANNNGEGYSPFFDSLAQKSQFYIRNFSNARRSIEGLPAVLCGIPAMMTEPILTSDFSSNRLDCLPRILEKRGYETHFLHGAHNGSMHFDTFSRIAGFRNFVGLNEYPKDNPEDLDEYWGVLDEPMLQYAIRKADESTGKFLISVFTLSSHHPYYIPPKYRGKFPKGPLEIHESIGYTDYALKRFFEVAQTKPWFNNTIFVLTGDHTQKTKRPEYINTMGGFRVPLIFYIPGLEQKKIPYDRLRITQHADILPSLYDLLGFNAEPRLLVGQSVFDLEKPGRSYNFMSHGYWFVDSNRFIDLGRDPSPTLFYSHTNTFDLQKIDGRDEESQDDLELLKSVVHYISEGLVANKLYDWNTEK